MTRYRTYPLTLEAKGLNTDADFLRFDLPKGRIEAFGLYLQVHFGDAPDGLSPMRYRLTVGETVLDGVLLSESEHNSTYASESLWPVRFDPCARTASIFISKNPDWDTVSRFPIAVTLILKVSDER